MRARDIARDRKSKPGAGLVLIARLVQAEEGLEHVLALLGGNAGPIVIDIDGQEPLIA